MKTFFRNVGYISIGVIISISTAAALPQIIKSVTAQLSTTRILPLQELHTLMSQTPKFEKTKTTPVAYGLPKIDLHNNGQPLQMDLNGDGLLDIVFSSTGSLNSATQYVLLNTGSGFEMAYFCRKDYRMVPNTSQIDQIFYQGDCGDPNYPLPRSPYYTN